MNYVYRHLLAPIYWFFCLLLVGFLPAFTQAQTITGTVFRDFNADGVYTAIPASGTYAYGEPGVPGVIVTAFSSNSATPPFTTTTNASGAYSLNVGSTAAFRIEFTNLVAGDFDGFIGTNSKSNIQFVTGGASAVNLGINYPPQYCQTNPYLVTTCYVSGNPLAPNYPSSNGTSVDPSLPKDAIVSFREGFSYAAPSTINHDASTIQVGSTWGVTYNRTTKKAFIAAFVKRHSGLGALGPGGIYVINYAADPALSAPAAATLITIPNVGTIASNTARNLTNQPKQPSVDQAGWDAVGKVGLGDLDMSDDGNTLFVVNLNTKRVVSVDLTAYNQSATTPTTTVELPAYPEPGCTNGNSRPFGLKYYRGKLYLGVICDGASTNVAATTGNTALSATVYVYNGTSWSTAVPTFSLAFRRGATHNSACEYWLAWTQDVNKVITSQGPTFNGRVFSQPILSDIEFDVDGSMILGFADRGAHMMGAAQPLINDPTNSTPVTGVNGGDIMRVYNNNGTFVVESAGTTLAGGGGGAPGITGFQNEGPGGGEFYADNFTSHHNTSLGGLALLPGTGEVLYTAIDITRFESAGVNKASNSSGVRVNGQELYQGFNGLYNKGAGLGDIEVLCNPAPIQIGNRVWRDTDNDGVQDAGEPTLAGLRVQLSGPGIPANTTLLTGSNGEYYFSNATGTNSTGFVYSLTGLTSGGSYSLSFPTSASAGVLSLSSKPNAATGTNADAIDTDVNGVGVISFILGQAGENNFTYDAAYVACTTPTTVSATATPNLVVAGSTITLTVSASGVSAGSTTYSWSGSGISSPTATTVASRTVVAPATAGIYAYSVVVSNGGTCTATATVSVTVNLPCGLSVAVGTLVCNTATNNYTATGTVSLTNSPAGSLTITDNSTVVTVVSVTAGQASATFSVSGLSNASSHTVTVISSASTCGTASRVYAAPASCSVCPLITVTPTTLPNAQATAQYSQTLTASGGQAPYSFSIISGSLPSNLILSSTGAISGIPLTSGITSVTVRVTDARNCTVVTPITITVGTGPVCSLVATASPGACQGTANTYTLTGTISANNGPATQSLTISVGNMYTVVTLNGNGPAAYVLGGLPAIGGTQTFSVVSSFGACGVTSQTFTAPVACAPMLIIDKQVDKARARLAELLTYTVRVANNSSIAATNVVVQDVMSDGLIHAPNSVSVTTGTFVTSATGGNWSIPSMPGNTTATLTYLVSVAQDGVQYNTASIPGSQAKVCTTVPIQICRGNPIAIQLDAPTGYTRYQWYLTTPTGTTLVSDITSNSTNAATANSYTATQPGEYQIVVDEGIAGSCPDLSCCPVIIEEVEIPPFAAQVRNPTCVGTTPQANGQITLTGLGANPSTYSYQISSGSTFNDNNVRVGGIVPANGIVATTLPAGTYTIRVTFTQGPLTCIRDLTTTLTAACGCKPDLCMPVMIVKTKLIVKRR